MIKEIRAYIKSSHPVAWYTARTTSKILKLIPRAYGYEARTCPICGQTGRFYAEVHFPDIFNFDAVCPKCGSSPRHRLLKLALDSDVSVNSNTRLLHFAPEGPVTAFIRPLVKYYRTADLFATPVDLKLNIENIDQPDQSWDTIICSHVLEHVDHVRALKELYRILAPGGQLLAFFPVVEAWPHDYEAPEVRSEHDRALHFGKENHLRRFGGSVRAEFAKAGFGLECYSPIGPEVVRFGLIPGETLFIATRP
jgi:SAM-dependent methyltransferase